HRPHAGPRLRGRPTLREAAVNQATLNQTVLDQEPMNPEGRPAHVLLLCGSRKPAADRPEVKSASRELLRFAAAGVRASGAPSATLDLRDLELPWWDGRAVAECDSPDLTRLDAAVRSANVLLASIPAYWGGMSGVFKNVIDLLGADAFRGSQVVPLVVGQDDASAWLAAGQLPAVCARLDAVVQATQPV